MNKYIPLTKALFKNALSFVDQGKAKKSKNYLAIGLVIFLLISLAPSLIGLYFITETLLEQLILINQEGALLALLFQGVGLLTFFLATFMVPAVFYFSKDIEHLLSLPLKPTEIIASKFTVAYLYELAIILLILTPPLLAYVTTVDVNLMQIIMLVVVVLALPLLPLIFASMLAMLIMWLIPLFKNRDLFNLLSGLIALGFALWINFAMGGIQSIDGNQIIDMIIAGDNSLIRLFKFIFFSYPFGIEAIVQNNILQFGIYLILSVLTLSLFLTLGHLVYFKGVIGINETASSRKRLTTKQLKSDAPLRSPFYRYLWKEMLLLIRTPVYFLNCVSIQFLLPLILLASLMTTSSQDVDLITMVALIPMDNPKIIAALFIVSIIAGLVIGSMNVISVTAISREGKNLYFMKMIPMNFMSQLHAKALSGILFSILGLLTTLVIVLYYLTLKPIVVLLIMLGAIIGIVFINYFGLLIDVIRPKLVWESEQAAVKQNLNSMFTILPSMAYAGFVGYLIYKGYLQSWYIVGGITILMIGATLIIIMILRKYALSLLLNRN